MLTQEAAAGGRPAHGQKGAGDHNGFWNRRSHFDQPASELGQIGRGDGEGIGGGEGHDEGMGRPWESDRGERVGAGGSPRVPSKPRRP